MHGNEKQLVKSRFVERVWLIALSLSRILKKAWEIEIENKHAIDMCSVFMSVWMNNITKTVYGK